MNNTIIIISVIYLFAAFAFILYAKTRLKTVVKSEPDWPAIDKRYPNARQELEKGNFNEVVKLCLRNIHGPKSLEAGQSLYVVFNVEHVDMSHDLKKRNPDKMTVVMQHDFTLTLLENDSFTVVLRFNDKQHSLNIPYNAITFFADPSVGFAFQRDDNG